MALPILTEMRQSVWDAIDNYAGTASAFKKKFRFEDLGVLNEKNYTPALGEMPALAMVPVSADTPWHTNQEQRISYGLVLTIYTPRLDTRHAELLWQELQRAIWQTNYVTDVCDDVIVAGSPTIVDLPAQLSAVAVGLSLNIVLHKKWNPRLDTDTLSY